MNRINSFLMNMSRALLVRDVRWSMIRSQIQPIIPQMSYDSHKGQMGRIGVIGGSDDYTGAPYYASKAALLFGGDLVFVFCAAEALVPIKSYSPEFMVTALYANDGVCVGEERGRRRLGVGGGDRNKSEEEEEEREQREREKKEVAAAMLEKMRACMWRLHVLVVGPGLGRTTQLVPGLLGIIELAVSENKPLVLDADALWLICHKLDAVRGHDSCVLTPNAREFSMLVARSLLDVEAAIAVVRAGTTAGSSDTSSSSSSSRAEDTCPAGGCRHEEEGQGQGYLARRLSLHELEGLLEDLRGGEEEDKDGGEDGDDKERRTLLQLRALSRSLGGVTVLLKGRLDAVSAGGEVLRVEGEVGAPRRCGGQGDILAGSVAVALHWALHLPPSSSSSAAAAAAAAAHVSSPPLPPAIIPPAMAAAVLAATATKRAAQLAFANKGRSTTSPDILDKLGAALCSLEE